MQLNGTTAKYTCKRIHLLRMNNTPLPRLGISKFQPAEVSVGETKQ